MYRYEYFNWRKPHPDLFILEFLHLRMQFVRLFTHKLLTLHLSNLNVLCVQEMETHLKVTRNAKLGIR